MTLQFSIALSAGMVAATLLPPVRRSIPRPVEVALWALLVFVCLIGVVSITDVRAREVTASAFWGVDQVINTLVGLLLMSALGWVADQRFAVASWGVLLCGADIVALALISSHRKSRAWQPRLRLGEWLEMPRPGAQVAQPVAVPYALDGPNRRLAAAMAVAGAALLAWSVNAAIWTRDVFAPRQARLFAHVAASGRAGSRTRLESLRETTAQLRYAAKAWYVAAGAPALQVVASRASDLRGSATELSTERMADIRVLLSAQSIGWYGSLRPRVTATEEEDRDGTRQTDRLAS